LIIATGHFQKGILLAPITAQLVVDWVSGQPPTVDVTPYSPDRFREPLLSIVSPKEVKR
jgi:glycine/D-amino acid oxidase-like deaminating enzyme